MSRQSPGKEASLGCIAESADGLVHMVSFAEYTLCGDALEGDHAEGHFDFIPECRPTRKKVITCPKCCDIIRAAKTMKTKLAWQK